MSWTPGKTPRGSRLATPGPQSRTQSRLGTPSRSRVIVAPTLSFCLADHPQLPQPPRFPSSGVKTLLVLKPLSVSEKIEGAEKILHIDTEEHVVTLRQPVEAAVPGLARDREIKEHVYNAEYYDEVFEADPTGRMRLHSESLAVINGLLQGRDGAIFAYGQTGSGKTFLMEGVLDASRTEWGIVPFVVEELMARVSASREKSHLTYIVHVAYLEVYNEDVFDLLSVSGVLTPLSVHENTKEDTYFAKGLREVAVNDVNQVLGLIALGNQRRRQAATDMNERSSRSFADVVLTVECLDRSSADHPQGIATKSCLHLVDMAGSERQGQTSASGERLKEASAINKTLTVLGRVVASRSMPKGTFSPYNDSVLTRLLKRTLSGEAMLLFLCCVSQDAANYHSTKNTVEFAMHCKKLSAQPTVRYLPAKAMDDAARGVQRLAELAEQLASTQLAECQQRLEEAERRANRFEDLLALQITGSAASAASANLVVEYRRHVTRSFRELGVLVNAFVAGSPREAEDAVVVMDKFLLEQVLTALGNTALVASIEPRDVLALLRAVLQVNYSLRAHPIVARLMHVFNALRGRATSAAWSAIVPFCFELLREIAEGTTAAPAFVVSNIVNCLAGIWFALKPAGNAGGAATPSAALAAGSSTLKTPAKGSGSDADEEFRGLAADLGADVLFRSATEFTEAVATVVKDVHPQTAAALGGAIGSARATAVLDGFLVAGTLSQRMHELQVRATSASAYRQRLITAITQLQPFRLCPAAGQAGATGQQTLASTPKPPMRTMSHPGPSPSGGRESAQGCFSPLPPRQGATFQGTPARAQGPPACSNFFSPTRAASAAAAASGAEMEGDGTGMMSPSRAANAAAAAAATAAAAASTPLASAARDRATAAQTEQWMRSPAFTARAGGPTSSPGALTPDTAAVAEAIRTAEQSLLRGELPMSPAVARTVARRGSMGTGGGSIALAAFASPPRAPDSAQRRRTFAGTPMGLRGPLPRPSRPAVDADTDEGAGGSTPDRNGRTDRKTDKENSNPRSSSPTGGEDGPPPAKKQAGPGGKAVPSALEQVDLVPPLPLEAAARQQPARQALIRGGSTPTRGKSGSSRLSLGDLRMRVEALRAQAPPEPPASAW